MVRLDIENKPTQTQTTEPEPAVQPELSLSDLSVSLPSREAFLTNPQEFNPVQQLTSDFQQEVSQLYQDAGAIARELFTPGAETGSFASFLETGQSPLPELDTTTQAGLDKERSDQFAREMLEVGILRNGNLLTQQTISDFAGAFASTNFNERQTVETSIMANLIATSFESAARNIEEGAQQNEDISNQIAQYASALADNPELIGRIAATVPNGADEATIRGIVEQYLAAERASLTTE